MKIKKTLSKLLGPRKDNIGLFYWSKKGMVNFGDQISRDVVEAMLIKKGKSLQSSCNRRLLALGSILHYAHNKSVIWGSGVNFKLSNASYEAKDLDIRAVRGPLTQNYLRQLGYSVPTIFGDPALLLKELYPGLFVPKTKIYDVSILPNLNDIEVAKGQSNNYHFISPNQHWLNVLDELQKSHFVITSSLHGVILSDLIGLEYRQMIFSNIENIDKYKDYYLGSGRSDFKIYSDYASALSGLANPKLDYSPAELMNSFPYDIWD